MPLCDGDTGAKWDERPPGPLLPCWPQCLLHPAASCSLVSTLAVLGPFVMSAPSFPFLTLRFSVFFSLFNAMKKIEPGPIQTNYRVGSCP